jgi:hypothetical protein
MECVVGGEREEGEGGGDGERRGGGEWLWGCVCVCEEGRYGGVGSVFGRRGWAINAQMLVCVCVVIL